eukprot:CAMPEP_0197531842 /NCGR_PEP_ID=MMETSP1318-20131121/37380_1 /TAXON_ID=552666 /ORGANISM="Partenskyella glossopodia, Strain RCC365" /LENGTH=381 /DNA_ID=CAMNT_0043088199 /DNA_START=67 /DNA_END=1212 /DNA_ORIENTATION=+
MADSDKKQRENERRIRVKSGYLLIQEGETFRAFYVQILPIFSSSVDDAKEPSDEDLTGMGLQISDGPNEKDYVRYGLLGCNVQVVGDSGLEFILHTQADTPIKARAGSVRARISWVQTIGACSAPVQVIKKVYRHLAVQPIQALEEELEDLNFAVAQEGMLRASLGKDIEDGGSSMPSSRVAMLNTQIKILSQQLTTLIEEREQSTKSKHTLQLVEWESAGGDEWPAAEIKVSESKENLDFHWLKTVTVTGVSDSRVALKMVTFYTMQAVAKLSPHSDEAYLIRFTKRFSEFLAVHYQIKKWYERNYPKIKLPLTPPKYSLKIFVSKHSSKFRNQRKADLEKYICNMADVPHMRTCSIFLDFINAMSRSPDSTVLIADAIV